MILKIVLDSLKEVIFKDKKFLISAAVALILIYFIKSPFDYLVAGFWLGFWFALGFWTNKNYTHLKKK